MTVCLERLEEVPFNYFPQPMSALSPKADRQQTPLDVRFMPIVLQKSPSRLCEIEICNNRIGASVLLNHCCSFVPDLESMFRDQMPKILLQHNLPEADIGKRWPTSLPQPLFRSMLPPRVRAKER